MIDIHLLGGFRVVVEDRVLTDPDWVRTRPQQLVQLLALAPGHRLVRDRVIDALWPDLDLEAGGANLRKAAHQARRVLGHPDAVVLRNGQVALFPDDEVRTDIAGFEAAARTALASGDPSDCAAIADSVEGVVLPGSPYDEWTAEPRRSIAATRLELLRAADRWADVVALEPTDEDAYRALMLAALADGRRAEAIRWYGVARAALASELGVGPGPELEALHAETVAELSPRRPVLVGRDLEVARATAALRHDPAGRVRAVAVRGPGGIGKSAVVRAVVDALDNGSHLVHTVVGDDPDLPYGPLIILAGSLLLDDPRLRNAVVPHVGAVLDALTGHRSDEELLLPLSRHQVVGALSALLRAVAAGRPTVLVADDIHDADDATVDALTHLATMDDLAVVVSYRPASARPSLRAAMDRIERADRLLTLDLTTLAPAQAERVVRGATERDLDDQTVQRIVASAGGNPFALIELARAADDTGSPLPRTAAEAIATRLVGLDPATMAMLERVALAETDLDGAAVAALAGVDENDAFTLLDRALENGVLVVADDRYRFRHDLVREALAAGIPPHRRAAVHRDAARRLTAAGSPPATIARHWLNAGDTTEAAPWCVAAAEAAVGLGAFVDARRHLAPVLDHEPPSARALRLDAECLDMLGEPAALHAYDAAIAVADAGDVDDLVVAKALAQIKQGDPAGGLHAIRGARPRSPMGRINEALAYAGAAALGATDPAVGTAKADECRRIALEAGDRGGIVIAAWAHAAAAHARGELHDSVLSDLRETSDLPQLAVRVFDGHLCMTQRFLYGSRPYPEVIRFAEELTAEAERLDAGRGRAFGITLRGEALYLSGRVADAETDLRAAVGLHRRTGGTTGEAHAVQRLAEIAHQAGEVHSARALIDEALDLARSSDIGFHLLDRIYGSRITLAAGPDEALAAVEDAEHSVRGPLETCPGCRVHLAVPAALASARAGDLDRAHAYADAVDYLADVVMRLPAWFAARTEVRGALSAAMGDAPRARQYFLAAAEEFSTAGQPNDARRCRAQAADVA